MTTPTKQRGYRIKLTLFVPAVEDFSCSPARREATESSDAPKQPEPVTIERVEPSTPAKRTA